MTDDRRILGEGGEKRGGTNPGRPGKRPPPPPAIKPLTKLVEIEFSKDIDAADVAIIGAIEDGKKVVNLYKVDRNNYIPKLKVKEVSHNIANLKELQKNSEIIGKLIFYNDESIESLMYILSEMYKVNLKHRRK